MREETPAFSSECYGSLTQLFPEEITITDLNGTIQRISEKTLRVHGFSDPEEVIGRSALDLIAPEHRQRAQQTIRKTLDQGYAPTEKYFFIEKNGTRFLGELSISLLRDVQGKPRALVVVTRNIAEWKQSEERVKHLDVVLHAIRNFNRLIVSEKNRSQLILEVCKQLTKPSGYSAVAIGLLDEEENWKVIEGSSAACQDASSAERLMHGGMNKPVRKALKQPGAMVVDADEVEGETGSFLVKDPSNRIMMSRMEHEGKVYGVISVVISVNFTTDEEDLSLLSEVADDLAFALYSVDADEERKRAEDRIRRDLKEKGLLLKEIHHRVKNNLQIISSLIYLQSRHIKDELAQNVLTECLNRIRSMTLIHESLYCSSDISNIDFKAYIEKMVHQLYDTYAINPVRTKMQLNVVDIVLNINLSIPCGLIINELVSNALKYAFPESFTGKRRIAISMRKTGDDEIELVVQDNGIGLAKDFDIHKTETCGLEIVRLLAENQLSGLLEVQSHKGTRFAVRFKP
jgi:PAS domain S-box-containing protein